MLMYDLLGIPKGDLSESWCSVVGFLVDLHTDFQPMSAQVYTPTSILQGLIHLHILSRIYHLLSGCQPFKLGPFIW